jgi:hypothetical protein
MSDRALPRDRRLEGEKILGVSNEYARFFLIMLEGEGM